MTKWYVTIDKHSSHIDDPDECAWTVSRDPNCTGWNTDSGYSGYGLTKADAEELANAANEDKRLRGALSEIVEECQNTGYGDPTVMERMIDRIEETASAAMRDKTK